MLLGRGISWGLRRFRGSSRGSKGRFWEVLKEMLVSPLGLQGGSRFGKTQTVSGGASGVSEGPRRRTWGPQEHFKGDPRGARGFSGALQ